MEQECRAKTQFDTKADLFQDSLRLEDLSKAGQLCESLTWDAFWRL